MKPAPFEYVRAGGLDEAVALLAERGPEAKVLAGGQSLVPLMNLRLARPSALIDLNPVTELAYVRERDGGLAVGAMARHHHVATSELVRGTAPLLAVAAGRIGFLAIRHRGTVAGSCCHADPAAEMPLLAVAMDAELTAVSARGARRIGAESFFLGHFTTALEPDEILTEIVYPPAPRSAGWAFEALSRKEGDFALVGVAARVTPAGGRLERLDLALAGVADRPVKVPAGEFAGADLAPALYERVGEAARELVEAGDVHGSREFRAEVAANLVRRVLARAAANAEGAR